MMRKIDLYILMFAATLMSFFSGCSNSFLEEDPNGYISQEQIQENAKWNPSIMLGQTLGTYSTTFAWQSGGTTNHDDFGQKSVDIATDLMSGDMAMSGQTYGWFSQDARLINSTKVRDRTYMIWRYYYRIVKACNEVFDAVGGDENLPENITNQIYFAQSKAMRAHAFFNLVNLYANPYTTNPNEKAIPLYRTQASANTLGLSTVEDVYDLVVSDLKEAIEILENTDFKRSSGTKDQIDQWVAKGILAYVYLTKGDNENAAIVSKDVIDNAPFALMTKSEIINSGFRTVDIPSWMWAFDITKDNTAGLPTFWGHVDYFTYSYCAAGDYKMIDENLYNEIPDSDERKNWFHPSVLISWYKFWDSARVGMGDRNWIHDIAYLRLEELYLINAEANARMNQIAPARTSLKTLLNNRDEIVASQVDGMDQTDLLDEIYFNWRVEMWAEGRGLLTMKRFKKTMIRGLNNYAYPGEEVAYDDTRLVFEIPEREIVNNPNLAK